MNIQKLLVIGAGQMGGGIAETASLAGLSVTIQDISRERVERGRLGIERSLARLSGKGKLPREEARAAMERIKGETDLHSAASEADFVIEAATENADVKAELFRAADQAAPGHASLASNTSSLSITRLGAATKRPSQVIGMHFFNPVPRMRLVEIVTGIATSPGTCDTVRRLAEAMGKQPVPVADSPGFCANRIMVPMLNEAVFALMEGVSAAADIDACATLGYNHPMGPLALCDLIGLDTILAIMEALHEGFGDPKYRPCPLLRQYVAAGWLGRKSGRGFYEYPEASK